MDTIKEPALQETPTPEPQQPEQSQNMEETLKKDKNFLAGRRAKNTKLIIAVSVVLVLLVGLFLWMEVFTVQVYLVSQMSQFDGDEFEPVSEIEFLYDGDGRITAEKHWMRSGNSRDLIYAERYNYDGQGRLYEHSCGTNENNTEFTYYSYDSNGHLKSYYITSMGRVTINSRCVCDDNGNLIRETFYDSNGQATRRVKTYEYNGDDRLVEVRECLNDECVERITYEYDDAGWIWQEVHYDAHGDVIEKIESVYYKGQLVGYSDGENGFECDYDGRGRITERRNFTDGRETNRIQYTYDSLGNLTRMEYYSGHTLQRIVEVRCDMSGNPISYTYCDEDGDPTGYSLTTTYERLRVSKSRAIELQEEYGDEYVIIDTGWFG